MKKRILAILMILVLMMSVAGCGGKQQAASFASAFEQQADMTTGVSDMILDFSFTGLTEALGTDEFNSISLKASSVVEGIDPVKASAEISYKYGAATEYKKLTTFIMDGEDIYINATELKTAITEVATAMGQGEIGIILAMFPTEEYLRINPTELQEYMNSMYEEMGISAEELGEEFSTTLISDVSAQTQAGIVIEKTIAKLLDEVAKDVKPEAIKADGSKVTLEVNKENIVALGAALVAADLEAYYDAMVKELEAIKGAEDLTTLIKDSKVEFLAQVNEMLSQVSVEELTEAEDFSFAYSLGTTGSKGKREAKNEVSFTLKDETDEMKVSYNVTTKEQVSDDKKVVVPETSTSYIELMNSIMEMFTAFE